MQAAKESAGDPKALGAATAAAVAKAESAAAEAQQEAERRAAKQLEAAQAAHEKQKVQLVEEKKKYKSLGEKFAQREDVIDGERMFDGSSPGAKSGVTDRL